MADDSGAIAPGLLLAPYSGDLPRLAPDVEADALQRMHSIPIFKHLGFTGLRIGVGWLECTVARNPEFDGIFDSFHGGLLMTAADSAAAIACLTVWGADSRITTTDMSIRFLAPARSDVKLFAQAIKKGRTLIPVAANFWRDDGALVAVATVTYMRLT
jgi:acyl-CoA thioesterase